MHIFLYSLELSCVHVVGKLPAWVINKLSQIMAPKVPELVLSLHSEIYC